MTNSELSPAKLVLVTGASSGIGAATAKLYGSNGAHVVLLARNEERLDAVATSIRRSGGEATSFSVDLADLAATARITAEINEKFGAPDILINNAGAGRWLSLLETSPQEAASMMAVPYLAAFAVTHAFLPGMLARGSGSVTFITSPASFLAWRNAAAYVAARHALKGLAEALRAEVKGRGVAISLVVLGLVETPYWEHNPGSRGQLPRVSERWLPTLSAGQAAQTIADAIERRRPLAVAPPLLRPLLWLNAIAPQLVARQLRRATRKMP